MEFEEKLAGQVIQCVYPEAAIEFVREQHTSVPDFQVRFPTGETHVFEVTRAIDNVRLSQKAAMSDLPFAKKRTSNDWIVWVAKHARINKVRNRIDDYLAEIEAAGLTRFSFDEHESVDPVSKIWSDLGVRFGNVGGIHEGILVLGSLSGGLIDSNVPVNAALVEANKLDNRAKLRQAEACKRHLLVWIEFQNYRAWAAMTESELPCSRPNLPPEIDQLWLAAVENEGSAIKLWIFDRANAWRELRLRGEPVSQSGAQSAR